MQLAHTSKSVTQALKRNGCVLGEFPLRVLPSKTAIVPVNNQYLPKTTKEREQCSRTIYAANIDKKVDRESVKMFFETLCGTQHLFARICKLYHRSLTGRNNLAICLSALQKIFVALSQVPLLKSYDFRRMHGLVSVSILLLKSIKGCHFGSLP